VVPVFYALIAVDRQAPAAVDPAADAAAALEPA